MPFRTNCEHRIAFVIIVQLSKRLMCISMDAFGGTCGKAQELRLSRKGAIRINGFAEISCQMSMCKIVMKYDLAHVSRERFRSKKRRR